MEILMVAWADKMKLPNLCQDQGQWSSSLRYLCLLATLQGSPTLKNSVSGLADYKVSLNVHSSQTIGSTDSLPMPGGAFFNEFKVLENGEKLASKLITSTWRQCIWWSPHMSCQVSASSSGAFMPCKSNQGPQKTKWENHVPGVISAMNISLVVLACRVSSKANFFQLWSYKKKWKAWRLVSRPWTHRPSSSSFLYILAATLYKLSITQE